MQQFQLHFRDEDFVAAGRLLRGAVPSVAPMKTSRGLLCRKCHHVIALDMAHPVFEEHSRERELLQRQNDTLAQSVAMLQAQLADALRQVEVTKEMLEVVRKNHQAALTIATEKEERSVAERRALQNR